MKKLLFIDDEPISLRVMKRSFKHFDLHGVLNADDALQALSEQTFDAVLTDYILPGMNGVSFAKQAKQQYPNLPIFLTSGYPPEDSDKLIEQGILSGYFDKPFDIKSLQKTILEHIN